VAVCLGLATTAVVAALQPPPAPTVAVPVAGRDLAVGHVLTAGDIRLARYPSSLVPSGTSGATGRGAVGRTLTTSVPAGMPLAGGLLGGGTLEVPAGRAIVHVPLLDAGLREVALPGSRVDVIAADGTGAPGRVVAQGATVLPGVFVPDDAAETSLLGGSAEDDGGLLLAVLPDEAAALAGAASAALLSVVVVG